MSVMYFRTGLWCRWCDGCLCCLSELVDGAGGVTCVCVVFQNWLMVQVV